MTREDRQPLPRVEAGQRAELLEVYRSHLARWRLFETRLAALPADSPGLVGLARACRQEASLVHSLWASLARSAEHVPDAPSRWKDDFAEFDSRPKGAA